MLKIARGWSQSFSQHFHKRKKYLKPYQYLLYSPRPWGVCQIKANSFNNVSHCIYQFDRFFRKLPYTSISAEDFYKLAKVMVLSLNPEYTT